MIQQSHFWVYAQRKQKEDTKNIYTCPCVNIIHNSWDMETTYLLLKGWLDKMWYAHTQWNIIQPREGLSAMDGSWRNYAKWGKSDTEKPILYDTTIHELLKKSNIINRE